MNRNQALGRYAWEIGVVSLVLTILLTRAKTGARSHWLSGNR